MAGMSSSELSSVCKNHCERLKEVGEMCVLLHIAQMANMLNKNKFVSACSPDREQNCIGECTIKNGINYKHRNRTNDDALA